MAARHAKKKTRRKYLNRKSAAIVGCLFFVLMTFIGVHVYLMNNYRTQDIYPISPSWKLKKIAVNHQIEGYVSAASIAPGDTINFHISCTAQSFTTEIFRMGWYGDGGAMYLSSIDNHSCRAGSIPAPNKSTGLINLTWPSTFRLHIPVTWRPGIYLAKLTSSDGFQNYVPFTIRSPQPKAPYLFVHSINTDLAYNLWGGNSLYHGSTPDLKLNRAVKVSLNRPFLMPGGGYDGSGNFLQWEYPMIRFLEKNGYQVDYATDIDIHEHPNLLLKYKAALITGHDEYWSRQMMEGYKNAVTHGVNLAIFAANTAYRPVRFEPDPTTGEPDRVMVNYKSADLDPFTKTNPKESTPAGWKSYPLSEPESLLLGNSYGGEVKNGFASRFGADLVVSDDSSWIFQGSGLKKGDKISGLVGYEYDKHIMNTLYPSGVDIVFHSPFINLVGSPDFADGTYYKLPNGGQVFDAGTMEWSWGLDPSKSNYSSQLVKVTENILNRFGEN